jgi:hypothetical protein
MKMLVRERKLSANKCEGEIELDTFDLADRVNKLLMERATRGLSAVVGVSNMVLLHLLRRPMPWSFLTKKKKSYYTKIHAWYKQIEHHSKLQSESFNKSTLEKDETDVINTEQVASETVHLLKINHITQGMFAQKKLMILEGYFKQLVQEPKPYANMNESERKIFQCMKRWTDKVRNVTPGKVKTFMPCLQSVDLSFLQNRHN